MVLRDPMDVLLSFYHFFEHWFFEPGTVSLEAFAREFWLERDVPSSRMSNASYFVHLTSWYERRHDPNVLMIFYEDLHDDLQAQVCLVAKFISTEKVSDISIDCGYSLFALIYAVIRNDWFHRSTTF